MKKREESNRTHSTSNNRSASNLRLVGVVHDSLEVGDVAVDEDTFGLGGLSWRDVGRKRAVRARCEDEDVVSAKKRTSVGAVKASEGGNTLIDVALRGEDVLVERVDLDDLFARREREAVGKLRSVPTRRVEVEVADVTVLEILCKANAVVGCMGEAEIVNQPRGGEEAVQAAYPGGPPRRKSARSTVRRPYRGRASFR